MTPTACLLAASSKNHSSAKRKLLLLKVKLEELVVNAADALKKKSTVLSVMLWWLHDKAEKSGLQEMLSVQLCSSLGEIHEKDGLILSLQHEKDILTAENRKLASCMAYRDMEFVALQEHKMILERSLHEVYENRGLLQQRLETLEAKWNAEKEKYSDCLAESSKLLSDKEKAMEATQMELAKAHTSLCASSAKITLLLETNAVRHEEWVAERSQLQSLQEQLQPELQSRDTLVVSLQRELESIPFFLIA
ncbi:unnamed protein product [Sphagnum jensenii]|uniref:Uncharacterized protein n=1 Tax=Sphagnum jensenii TaxID=128206 RepID=A0ABP0VN79_9BRYO